MKVTLEKLMSKALGEFAKRKPQGVQIRNIQTYSCDVSLKGCLSAQFNFEFVKESVYYHKLINVKFNQELNDFEFYFGDDEKENY